MRYIFFSFGDNFTWCNHKTRFVELMTMVRRCWRGDDLYFLFRDRPYFGDITEIVVQRSGDLQFKSFVRPSARLLMCAMRPQKPTSLTPLFYNMLGEQLHNSNQVKQGNAICLAHKKENIPLNVLPKETENKLAGLYVNITIFFMQSAKQKSCQYHFLKS